MATSKIKIYQTVLTPARNALVDDLEDYLGSLTPTYSNDTFQYIKLDLDLNIKVAVPQGVISGHSLGNYVRIEQDDKVWYYFIMNTDWKSTSAVEMKLSIDSINTFRNDLTFTDKTIVGREHGDRLLRQSATGSQLIRTIDKISEQIPVVKIRHTAEYSITQPNLDFNWYLMYKTKNDLSPENPNNPISCYCFADEKIKLAEESPLKSKTYTYEDFAEGTFYYFNNLDNPGGIVENFTLGSKVDPVVNTTASEHIYQTDERTLLGLVLYRNSNKLYYALQFDGNILYIDNSRNILSTIGPGLFESATLPGIADAPNSLPMSDIDSVTITKGNFFRISPTYYPIPEQAYLNATQTMAAYIGQTALYTNTITDIDKTDSRIVKIIKLPYAPCEIIYSNGICTFPQEWIYDNGLMKLNDASLSTEFLNTNCGKTAVNEFFAGSSNINKTGKKQKRHESKLYHSDFYSFKLVYDNFVKEVQLERYDTTAFDRNYTWRPNDISIWIDFKPTNTINSKFAFKINYYLTDNKTESYNFADYAENVDYDKYLLISRNNEETIFSSDYLNYIRTGFNYDKKAKAAETSKNWINFGIQTAATIVTGLAAATFTGGLSIAAAVASASGTAASLVSNIYAQQNSERAIQSKLASLAAQSAGVAGTDDVDLLSYYNTNRLQVIKYAPETAQSDALYNLFFYCGYRRDMMKLPALDTRYWFNFVQCKPIFTEEGITPYNDYIDDVKARYQAGVTIYHHHPGVGTEWDWQQEYENWENYLITE